VSYPILRFAEHPDVVPVVVQRFDEPSTGAGEEANGRDGGCCRQCVFRRDRRAAAAIPDDAGACALRAAWT
jgi:hypothetical protein